MLWSGNPLRVEGISFQAFAVLFPNAIKVTYWLIFSFYAKSQGFFLNMYVLKTISCDSVSLPKENGILRVSCTQLLLQTDQPSIGSITK